MRPTVRSAFTLVEILIVVVILGILAAIVIPMFTNASQDAARSNVQSQLQQIRNQIELYRMKNNGTNPNLVGVNHSAFSSLTNPPPPQIPYFRDVPVNPRNGSRDVVTSTATGTSGVSVAAAAMDPMASGAGGWLYNQSNGAFAAIGFNDATNKWFGEP